VKALPARGQILPLVAINAQLAVDPVLLESIYLVSYAVRIYLTDVAILTRNPDASSVVLVGYVVT
jgi:hypothetical protein